MHLRFHPENAYPVAADSGPVLVAAKSMSLFDMDAVSEAILQYGQVRPACTLEQITQALADRFSALEVSETVEEFVRLQIFETEQSSKTCATKEVPELNVEHFPVSSVVVNVANKCNLHCTYCYEPEEAKYGAAPVEMEWETAQTSVDFLFKKAGNNPEVSLIFFGGEALLNFKLMRRIVTYAEEKGHAENKKVDFSITTNGTLLTDSVIDFFQRHRFGVTISIDGPKDLHDRRRSFLTSNGSRKGSYDVIRPRLERLFERYTARPVVARVTVTKDAIDIVRTYEHLNGLGFFEVGFSPVTAKNGEEYGLEPADLHRVLAGFRELGAVYVERAAQSCYTGFSNLSTLLTDIHVGTNKFFPCRTISSSRCENQQRFCF